MRKFVFASALSGLILTTLFSCKQSGKKGNAQPPPVSVSTYTVEPQKVTYYDSWPGTITALKEVQLRGQVTGYVTGIFFTEGSRIKAGQKLYEIDRRQYESAFRESEGNLQIAKDNLSRTQKDFDRYSELNSQDAISRQQFDHALADLSTARSQVSVALEGKVKAATNLEYSVISSPFDGSIGISQVKIGDLITPGQTLLNTVSSDDPMGVDVAVNQSDLRKFQEFLMQKPAPGDTTFRIMLPDNTLYPPGGRIQLIDRAVDPQTGTIRVRMEFSNPERNLRPGMNCNLRVMHHQEGLQILIPFKAVLEQMGEYFIFLKDNNVAKEKKVTLGPRVGPGVLVLDGLNEGDVIVVDGIEKLSDGAAIATGPPRQAGGENGGKPGKY